MEYPKYMVIRFFGGLIKINRYVFLRRKHRIRKSSITIYIMNELRVGVK